MRNTLKHLTLLTRMKDDGLLPALTGSFSEDAMAQALMPSESVTDNTLTKRSSGTSTAVSRKW